MHPDKEKKKLLKASEAIIVERQGGDLGNLGPQLLVLLRVLQKVDKFQNFHFSLFATCHMPGSKCSV